MRQCLSFVMFLCVTVTPTLSLAQDKFFDANGVKIRYVEQGTGEPVVLLHGVGGTLQSWMDSGVFQKLAVDHRVIAFDARGHGKSGKPHDPKQYGREMALDALRLLDHLSLSRAHIVGYSLGASSTAQVLILQPDRFMSAVLGGGVGRLRWTDEDDKRAEQMASEFEKECVSRTLAYQLAPTNGPKPSEEELQKRSAACLADASQDRFAIAAVFRARRDEVITLAQAAAVTVPTMAIVGSLDSAQADVQELKKMRPALKVVVIEGAVHASGNPQSAMRSPVFIAAVREFIAAQGRSSTH